MEENFFLELARRGYLLEVINYRDQHLYEEGLSLAILYCVNTGNLRSLINYSKSENARDIKLELITAISKSEDFLSIIELSKNEQYREYALNRICELGKLDIIKMLNAEPSYIKKALENAGELGLYCVMDVQREFLDEYKKAINKAIGVWQRNGDQQILEVAIEILEEKGLFPEIRMNLQSFIDCKQIKNPNKVTPLRRLYR